MRALFSLLFVLATLASAPVAAQPLVETSLGPVLGAAGESETEVFLGLPFAAPPVGDLRWRAPADPQPWSEPRVADRHAPRCTQMRTGTDPDTGRPVFEATGSEDCLYLDVYRPAAPSDEPRPVMVWIHGGANVSGSAGGYDGSKLAAAEDVIVVVIQYRMSLFGFFNHPPVYAGDPLGDSGNFGLLDQIKALEWVRLNVPAFGGDPTRVMAFGESAGGFDIWSLQLSGLAEGLFHTAAIESGCPYFVTLEDAQDRAERIVEALVVDDRLATKEGAPGFIAEQGPEWVRDYLYSKQSGEILEVVSTSGASGLLTYYGIGDGVVLPLDPVGALERGDYRGVPSIIGANRDEMKLFASPLGGIGPVGYTAVINGFFGEVASEVSRLYPLREYRDPLYYNRIIDIMDGWLELTCGTYGASLAAAHQPVWHYRFDYDNLAPPLDDYLGAAHSFELPFIWSRFKEDRYPEGTEEERLDLSRSMQRSWACLARTGDAAACPGAVDWPPFVPPAGARLLWDTTVRVEQISPAEQERIDFWVSTFGLEFNLDVFLDQGGRAHQAAMEMLGFTE